MSFIEILALVVIFLADLYLLTLGTVSLVAPVLAKRFLLGFADSRTVHYLEILVRFVVGVAFVIYAPRMFLPNVFNVFGWVLLVTTAGLFLVPWRWHYRFAKQAVPGATRYITLIGLASLVMGGFVLASVVRGSFA
jgi:hypothetical protein